MSRVEREANRARRQAPETPDPLRKRAYRILEAGHLANLKVILFDAFLIVLILANVVAVTLESVPEFRIYEHAFDVFEWVSVAIFAVEYCLRLWVSIEDPRYGAHGPIGGRLRYAASPIMIIDFLSFAPTIVSFFIPLMDLRVLRLFRLLRLMKIARYSPALSTLIEVIKSERRALFGTLLLLLCVMVISAEFMYVVEGPAQPKTFGSLPSAMYWAITTLTTTGYGDVVPITPLGRMVAGVTMIFGLGLFALPVGIVATNFVTEIHRRDFVVTWSMISHLPLFEGFSAAAVSDVMNVLRSRMVQEHTEMTMAGHPATEMFFIVSGTARADYGRGGISLGPGDFFGEEALLSGKPHEATVTARSPMRMLTLSALDFAQLTRKHPKLRRRFESVAARKEQKLQARASRRSEERGKSAAGAEDAGDVAIPEESGTVE
jgi:voltage-gated potassium channel